MASEDDPSSDHIVADDNLDPDFCYPMSQGCRLLRECEYFFYGALFTPFSVYLGSGTLAIGVFNQFRAAELIIMDAFAEGCAMIRKVFRNDEAGVFLDLENQIRDTLNKMGCTSLDLIEDNDIDKAALVCKEHVLKLAEFCENEMRASDAVYAVTYMTGFMSLYSFIAGEFRKVLNLAGTQSSDRYKPYVGWMDFYASKQFQASVTQTTHLMEKLISRSNATEAALKKTYTIALEDATAMFSRAVPSLNKKDHAKDSILIFVDVDSVLDLPVNAYSSSTEHHRGLIFHLDQIEYESFFQRAVPIVQVQFNFAHLHEKFEKLSELKMRENHRVLESGKLKGIDRAELKREFGRVSTKPWFVELLMELRTFDVTMYILSCSWCGDFIRDKFPTEIACKVVEVIANEILFDDHISTGEVSRVLETPIHKAEAVKCRVGNNLTVSIGWALDDLLCLLEADIGIAVGREPTLMQTGKKFGVSFVPLFRGLVNLQQEVSEGKPYIWKRLGNVYLASGSQELRAFMRALGDLPNHSNYGDRVPHCSGASKGGDRDCSSSVQTT